MRCRCCNRFNAYAEAQACRKPFVGGDTCTWTLTECPSMQRSDVETLVTPTMVTKKIVARLIAIGLFGSLLVGYSCCQSVHADDSANDANGAGHLVRVSPVVRAIRNCEAAVVNIQGNKTVATAATTAGGVSPGRQEVNGMGTGVIIDPRGYIITNLHVVQDVSNIEVTLSDGTVSIAKLLNYDPDTDLALIRIPTDKALPVIPMGSSHDLMRGESVIAIGNPFGYQHSVTVGIISALHRNIPVNGTQEYRDLIQTNADINPGNSGGPLVNIEGRVIGINVAVRVGAQGIGFAIPIDAACEVMADLIAAAAAKDLSLGITVETKYNESRTSAVVHSVNNASVNSVKSDSDLAVGDVIESINGREVHSRLDALLCLVDQQSGDSLPIIVKRDGQSLASSLSLISTTTSRADEALAKDTWERLGVKLVAVPKSSVQSGVGSEKFSGGLKVVEVRSNSPAAREKITRGDIIVGIMAWQTPNLKALSWILDNEEFAASPSAKFYVYRDNQFWTAAMKVGNQRVR
jgi:serine protease Do